MHKKKLDSFTVLKIESSNVKGGLGGGATEDRKTLPTAYSSPTLGTCTDTRYEYYDDIDGKKVMTDACIETECEP